MIDIRNGVVLAMPASVMPALIPTMTGESMVLRLNQWNGNPDVWSVTTVAEAATSFAAVRELGAAIASLLGGATGPLEVDEDVTMVVDHGTSGGRSVIELTLDGDGPHPLDIASGYAARCAEAMLLREFLA